MAGARPPGNRGLGCAEVPQQSETSSAAEPNQLTRSEGILNTYTRCPKHTKVTFDAIHAAVTKEFVKKRACTTPHVCVMETDMRRHQ